MREQDIAEITKQMNQFRVLVNHFDDKIETIEDDGLSIDTSNSIESHQRAIQEQLINLRESAQYILHHSGTIEDETVYTPSREAVTITESNGELVVEATEDVDALTVTVGEIVVDEPTSVIAGDTFTYQYTDEERAFVEWESVPSRADGTTLPSTGVTENTDSEIVLDRFEQDDVQTYSDYVSLNQE